MILWFYFVVSESSVVEMLSIPLMCQASLWPSLSYSDLPDFLATQFVIHWFARLLIDLVCHTLICQTSWWPSLSFTDLPCFLLTPELSFTDLPGFSLTQFVIHCANMFSVSWTQGRSSWSRQDLLRATHSLSQRKSCHSNSLSCVDDHAYNIIVRYDSYYS